MGGGNLKNVGILRQKAEEALKERQSQLNLVRSEPDMLRLVHELEVHQIELEMQNDELQLAKEQAELATAKYVELYEFAPSGYFILTREGKIIQLNIAGSQIFGRDRSQLINHQFAFFVSDESKPVLKQFLSRVFSSNTKETCDLSLAIPNSLPMQVQISALAENNIDECFVTMVDITELKRNEKKIILANEELAFQNEEKAKRAAELTIANEELAFQNEEKAKRAAELDILNKELVIRIEENNQLYSEQISLNRMIAFQRDRLEEIASLVPGVVYQYRLRSDGTSCFPYASKAIRQIYRVTPEEVREDATKVFANLHPDDHDGVVASILTSAKELTLWQHEYRVKFVDGTIRTLFGNSLPRLEEDGSVLWHGFITDITNRKANEEEKLKADTTIRTLSLAINQSPVTLVITDLEGNVESVNPRFTETTGYTAEEVIGKNLRILQAGDQPVTDYKNLWDTILSGGNWSGNFHNRKKNGDLYWESAVISPVKDQHSNITHFLAVKEDITSRLNSEQKIKLQNEELQKLNSEKNKFFSIIAHDLRGPLGGLMALTEMMADESIEFTETEKKEMTLSLKRSARNTFNLLENLLQWSQIDRGHIEFKPQSLDLIDMVTECRNIVAESARKKMIELLVIIPNQTEVFADKNMVLTVIRNLLSNAIKFTPSGGEVTISAKPAENDGVLISVKDTGIGMSDLMRDNLFIIGANTMRQGTDGEKSTGLGLLLCKQFVEKHHDRIWVESVVAIGSTFFFTIPFIPIGALLKNAE
jgi:PAS domain S-box-containing protein